MDIETTWAWSLFWHEVAYEFAKACGATESQAVDAALALSQDEEPS